MSLVIAGSRFNDYDGEKLIMIWKYFIREKDVKEMIDMRERER